MIPKEQYNALASIAYRYASGNPWSEEKLTVVQDQLLADGYITLRPHNNRFLLIPTAKGWYLIRKDTPYPTLDVEMRSYAPTQTRTFKPQNPSASFNDYLNGLVKPFLVNKPAEVTFHNFKIFMSDKTYQYDADWKIDDFRRANKYLYDVIGEALPESNKTTLHTLLDMLFYMLVIRDKQQKRK